MSESLIFVSARVVDQPHPVQDSVTALCHRCRFEVWISPASRALYERSTETLCLPCALNDRERFEEGRLLPPNPQQAAELLDHIKRERDA